VGDHRPGGVEHDGITHRPGRAAEHRVRRIRIGLGVAADQLGDLRTGKP
jgi:hypothetical protein